MPLNLNYKSGLTLLYNLLRSEHRDGAGFKGTEGTMAPYAKPYTKPHEGDLGPSYYNKLTVANTHLKNIIAVLKVCSPAKRVEALAWVKREMLIKEHVLVEGSPIYQQLIDEFQINEKEVNRVMVRISSK